MGKLSRGRGNARNSAQIKNDFFVTAMLQSRDHPPPGAKYERPEPLSNNARLGKRVEYSRILKIIEIGAHLTKCAMRH